VGSTKQITGASLLFSLSFFFFSWSWEEQMMGGEREEKKEK
jgi:hypothetical protein